MTTKQSLSEPGFEHVGSFAELTSREGSVRHRAYQIIDRRDLAQVERFERYQAVGNGIVEFAVNALAFFVNSFLRMPWLGGVAFLFQGMPPSK